MVKQGDIILIDFDPVKGHEQGKKRPALVISSDKFNKVCGGLALVCPISHANNFPYHLTLPEGLKTDGKVLCQHVRTFDVKTRGYTLMERVPGDFLNYVISVVETILEMQ